VTLYKATQVHNAIHKKEIKTINIHALIKHITAV